MYMIIPCPLNSATNGKRKGDNSPNVQRAAYFSEAQQERKEKASRALMSWQRGKSKELAPRKSESRKNMYEVNAKSFDPPSNATYDTEY